MLLAYLHDNSLTLDFIFPDTRTTASLNSPFHFKIVFNSLSKVDNRL